MCIRDRNKYSKIGLTALAGSLISVSAHAGSLSASGSASLSFADSDVDNTQAGTAEGNQWSMGDSITMTGSGDMDNGMSISVSYEIDNDDTGGGNVYDSHSMTLDTNGMGTITFAGHGGSSAMSALDDVTPNAYEESWDVVTGADTGTRVNGSSGDNMFTYKSPTVSGATVTVGYLPASDTVTDVSYTDFAIAFSPEAVDGLTVGYASGDKNISANVDQSNSTGYIKYAVGGFTLGYQVSESDHDTKTSSLDSVAYGVSYAVNDDISIGYSYHEVDMDSGRSTGTFTQESTGISASYTMGGKTHGLTIIHI